VANIYDTIIADSNTKVTALQQCPEHEGVRKTKALPHQGKDDGRTTLQEFISDNEGIIKGTFGKKSVTTRVFSARAGAFHKATDENFILMVNGWVTKVVTTPGDLGAPFVRQ